MNNLTTLISKMKTFAWDSTIDTTIATDYINRKYVEMPNILMDTWLDWYFRTVSQITIQSDALGNYILIPNTAINYKTPQNIPYQVFNEWTNRKVYLKRGWSTQPTILYTAPTKLSGVLTTVFQDENIDELLAMYSAHEYLTDIRKYDDADRLRQRIQRKEEGLFSLNQQEFIDYDTENGGQSSIILS